MTPKYTAAQFWQLLPRAVQMLTLKAWRDRIIFEMIAHPLPVSGRRNPAPGETMRWYIQSNTDHGRVDPVTAVVWLVTGEHCDVSNRHAGDAIGLSRSFQARLTKAIYMNEGYEVAIRRKLHAALKIDDRYLRPTTA